MRKNTFRIIAIVALIVAIFGLLSYVGSMRPVNLGAFIFPMIISGVFFWLYKK